MGYTVKDVKAIIEDLDDDTPLFGFILGPNDVDVFTPRGEGAPNKDEWAKLVERADQLAGGDRGHTVWDGMWDIMNDAKGELFPEDD